MPYRILAQEPVEEGVRRVAREQIRSAIDEIDGGLSLHESVHQVRKRCKKVRAVVRLVRFAIGAHYSKENARLRDAARRLSDLRDATALLETFDVLMDRNEEKTDTSRYEPLREALEQRREDLLRDDLDADAHMSVFRDEMEQAWADVGRWTLESDGFKAVREGLTRTYRRGRKALQTAYSDPRDDHFHELRKRAKYHWYHVRLLQDCWKPALKTRRDQQKMISDLLGDDHDLAVLEQTILGEPDRFDMRDTVDRFFRLLTQRRSELQTQVRFAAERLYAEPPDVFAHRMGRYWETWHEESAHGKRTIPVGMV